jgi:diadenylate cyclase
MEGLLQSLQITSLADLVLAVIDITIVSYLLYRVLILIRGTKAVPILIGLVLVLIAFFVSKDEYLGLSAFNWILEKFTTGFILLIIVIFQDDIRRGLAHVGRSRFLMGTVASSEAAHSLEEVVKACTALSKRRIGALMAIEREGELADYIEEGIPIQARLSSALLFALFNPSHANPTHDGAVIIRQGIIAAAGCFLPLTANPRLPQTLGTRHRAGVGLSEETDAVVCVVSEETGTISVAFQGHLTRDLDANKLRELLQRLLTLGEPGAGRGALESPWRAVRRDGSQSGSRQRQDLS